MGHRDIVVIGASAGGIEALSAIARQLPADLGAAVFVVLHLAPEHKSVLPRILSSAGPLPAKHARNGEAILPNRIYVAPPDHHLLIHENHVRVVRGPRENGHRPAIDPHGKLSSKFSARHPRRILKFFRGAGDLGPFRILSPAIPPREGV